MGMKNRIIPWLLFAQQATAFSPTCNNRARSTIDEQTQQGLCMAKNNNKKNPFSDLSSRIKENLGVAEPDPQPLQPLRTMPISTKPPTEDDEESSSSSSSTSSGFGFPWFGKEEPKMEEYSFSIPEQPPQAQTDNNNNNDKFGMAQRLESVKCVVVGALAGSLAVAPVAYFHYVNTNLAQWEFTTDMAALQAALFAIVYRYAIRDDENPMLNQGVIGAFVVVRTLSNIHVSDTCAALPLQCGEPLGYFDWNMLYQASLQGLESAVLFGAVSLAMDFAFEYGWISKFK